MEVVDCRYLTLEQFTIQCMYGHQTTYVTSDGLLEHTHCHDCVNMHVIAIVHTPSLQWWMQDLLKGFCYSIARKACAKNWGPCPLLPKTTPIFECF